MWCRTPPRVTALGLPLGPSPSWEIPAPSGSTTLPVLHLPPGNRGNRGETARFFFAKTKVTAVLKTTRFTCFKANDGASTSFGSRGFWRLNATLVTVPHGNRMRVPLSVFYPRGEFFQKLPLTKKNGNVHCCFF